MGSSNPKQWLRLVMMLPVLTISPAHADSTHYPGRTHYQAPQALEALVVDGVADVEPVVALQPDQVRAEHGGDRTGQRRLADARLAFEQQRSP